MKLNRGKCKAVSFTKARAKEQIRYYFGDQLMEERNSFTYLVIIIRSDQNWQIVSIAHCGKHGRHLIA